MTTQPEAQRLLEKFFKNGEWTTADQILAAAELQRLQEGKALAASLAAKADRIDRLGEMVERLQTDKRELLEALKMAVRQNSHDMMMVMTTGAELRRLYAENQALADSLAAIAKHGEQA